ncbi:MAG: EAL domain-containing protein [Pseudomonadota bacterium]|nr:EAL domain-containing protein [Pseudomonadota bacterium]
MIHPVFQPIYCAESGSLVGAEVLARWRDNSQWVCPSDLNQKIQWLDVDQEILRNLLRNVETIKSKYPILFINVSADTLSSPECLFSWTVKVRKLQAQTGIKLCCEVTETVPNDLLKHSWNTLKSMDVLLFMDDYGHEHSTFSRLIDYPWDGCKFDMKRLQAGYTEDRCAIRYCLDSGLSVVGEQVESAKIALKAMEEGLIWHQGFYYGDAEKTIGVSVEQQGAVAEK